MGWFNKKEEKRTKTLPDLPKLPEFPHVGAELPKDTSQKKISQLPSFPNNSLGEKFSQNTIKDAVTGKKEGEKEEETDEFEERPHMMPEPPKITPTRISFAKESPERIPEPSLFQATGKPMQRLRKEEPIFIRLDKFEESLANFEEIKKIVEEMEKVLEDTKDMKTKEEEEIGNWENEIKSVKDKIKSIDREIFSKVE